MDRVLTYSTSFCRILTDYLIAHGHDRGPVLAALGVDEAALADRDGRIARRAWLRAFEVAVEVTGTKTWGSSSARASGRRTWACSATSS